MEETEHEEERAPADALNHEVAALVAAYASCETDEVYRTLEEQRRILWPKLPKGDVKARLKAAADAAAGRILATIDAPKSEDDSERQPGED